MINWNCHQVTTVVGLKFQLLSFQYRRIQSH